MHNGKKLYTFFWFIENYSSCWHENGSDLYSPKFTIDKFEGTTWELNLYPRGMAPEDLGYMSLFLSRSRQDDGPENISLDYELAVIAVGGSTTLGKCKDTFVRGDGFGHTQFLKRDKILLERRPDYLPQDILTVCCKIWKGEGNVHHIGESSARTRIGIEYHSFLHVVDKFSTLQPNVKQTIQIQPHSEKGCSISSCMYFTAGLCCREKIIIEIVPSDTKRILCKCELFLLDASGNVIKCGGDDNRCDATRKNISILPLSLSREEVLNRKNEYLPGDKLSLICECHFSSTIEFQTIERTLNETSLSIMKRKTNFVSKKIDYNSTKKVLSYPNGLEDIKTLYINQCLTDVELRTNTKSFSAHKIILCARSPVFKAMMTSDMKEKNTDCIHVDDLENDIVQQLLLFLYSDRIEHFEWENTTQLYYAADKYQIGRLKEICSAFLVENLNPTNAVKLLLLANTHSDIDLKKLVEDFILEHDEQVFSSREWDEVAEANPVLALKTMQLKYKRKNEKN